MNPLPARQDLREFPEPAADSGTTCLSVVLPHTDLALTGVALREAARMVHGLRARVTVMAVRIVPFPEPLDPTRGFPGLPELMELARAAEAPVTINIIYSRDWESACDQLLSRGSLIVMAVRKCWMRSREERLANWLSRAGHKVTLVRAREA